MWFLVFILLIVFIVYCIDIANKEDSKNTSANRISPNEYQKQQHEMPKEDEPILRNVSPTGRILNWNNYGDICFAIGSFIEGTNANGFVTVAENGKLIFQIGNFTNSYSTIGEKVPSDVIDFLFSKSSILKKNYVEGYGTVYKLKFELTYANMNQKNQEDALSIISSTAHNVSSCILDGANRCAELLERKTLIQIREETLPFASHITYWINR